MDPADSGKRGTHMSLKCIGIDIGGTSVKLGIFEEDGTLVKKWEVPTRKEEDGKYILGDIAASIRRTVKESRLELSDFSGAGMGFPGPVLPDGHCEVCVNLGWKAGNPQQELSRLLDGMPVKSGNDANVAALGEMWQGGGKGYKNLVMVTLGTGVGGGIIIDGKIVAGAHGAGGEIGHVTVVQDEKEACNCGNKGCLEQYASANGIVRLAQRYLQNHPEMETTLGTELTSKEIWDKVKENDKAAVEIAEQMSDLLGKALAAIACVVNPEAFVIGGGMSKAGEILLEYVQKAYVKNAFHASRNAQFKLAQLGNNAGIYGGVKLVL